MCKPRFNIFRWNNANKRNEVLCLTRQGLLWCDARYAIWPNNASEQGERPVAWREGKARRWIKSEWRNESPGDLFGPAYLVETR